MRLAIHVCLLVFILAFAAIPSSDAADLPAAMQGLLSKKATDKISAIKAIAATADARSLEILRVLQDGRLYYQKSDKRIVLTEKQGKSYKLTDALSLESLGEVSKSAIKKISINNKIRQVITAALAGLTLMSPDRDRRLAAAQSLSKNKSGDILPLLEEALASETDDAVALAMRRSRAALQLAYSKDVETALGAIEALGEFPDQEVKGLLAKTINGLKNVAEPTAGQQALLQAAVKQQGFIEERLAFFAIITNIFQGVSLGSVLLLAAIGLAVTFGVMGVINMAHGEMVMIGAYTTYVVQQLFLSLAPAALDYSLVVAIPAAFTVAALFGVAIERGIIRFLYGRPLETLLATWGLSLILQQFVRTMFGPTNKEVIAPGWLSGAWDITGGLSLTYNRIGIIIFAALVLLTLLLVLRKTAFGLQMRAVTQNRSMASSMGIRTGWVDAMTFGLGSGVAGMAGVALSQIDNVSPNLGQSYIVDSFMVVVFGGVGNLWGTLVGALSLGVTNKFLEPFTGAVLAKIFILVAIILFIQKRPRGLFALRGRSVEG